ncbi:DUF2147 domain-containing protein [bacterium]|nr:DUF2147 domain-containing protein [bacterium]
MKVFWFCLTLVFSSLSFAGNADDLLGLWLNEEGTAKIEIYKQDGKFFGKIVWLKDPTYTEKDVKDENHPSVKLGAQKVDFKNPDAAHQNDPILGLVILRNFNYDADDEEWVDGKIYDPKKGADYKAFMKLENPDKLYLRGYIGFSLIGRTSYWSRTK